MKSGFLQVSRAFLVAILVGTAAAPFCSAQALTGGGRSSGLGDATTAMRSDVWGSNPASWGTLDGRAVSFFASQSFGLSELRYSSFQYVEPLSFGSVAAGLSTFGFSDFRDTRVSLGFARGFSFGSLRKLYLGLAAFYSQVAITGYGSDGTVGISLGGLADLTEYVGFGFSVENINSPSIGSSDDLPVALSSGVQYRPGESFLLLADVRKEVDRPMTVRAGFEVQPAAVLFLRAGVGSEPARFSGGMGVRLGILAADIAFQRHEVLGWTPAGGLSVLW